MKKLKSGVFVIPNVKSEAFFWKSPAVIVEYSAQRIDCLSMLQGMSCKPSLLRSVPPVCTENYTEYQINFYFIFWKFGKTNSQILVKYIQNKNIKGNAHMIHTNTIFPVRDQ